MSNLMQFLGSSAVPVGAFLSYANGAPSNQLPPGAEYLRTGVAKVYDVSYADSMTQAPHLRIFGNDAKTQNPAYGAGSYYIDGIYYVGTNYVAYQVQSGAVINQYSASLATLNWSTPTGIGNSTAQSTAPGASNIVTRLANNGTYLVVPHGTAATGPWVSSNGSSYAIGTGTFTGMTTVSSALCFNNTWLHLSALDGGTPIGYCLNANPATGWAVQASSNIGMPYVFASAHNGATIVHVGGGGSSATAGKIGTATSVNGAVTDRTATCGITFNSLDVVVDAVYTGTLYVVLIARVRTGSVVTGFEVATSPDGLNYTLRPSANSHDAQPGVSGAMAYTPISRQGAPLCTNGAGQVTCFATASNVDHARLISVDNGITWTPAQIYQGKAGVYNPATMSFANGKWISNHNFQLGCCIDHGASLATPDLMGVQKATAGQYVRVK